MATAAPNPAPAPNGVLAVTDDASPERNVLRTLWEASGLTFTVYGPGSATELAELIRNKAPDLQGETFGGNGIMEVSLPDLTLYVAFLTGPSGSACTISEGTTHTKANTDRFLSIFPAFDMIDSPTPTRDGSGVWSTSIFSRGSASDAELELMIQSAFVVPFDDFFGFERPGASVRCRIPQRLFVELLGVGWTPVDAPTGRASVGTNIRVTEDRSNVVFFGTPRHGFFQLATRVATSHNQYLELMESDIEVPEHLTVEPPNPGSQDGAFVVLEVPMVESITVDQINEQGIALAVWADGVERQIWGTDEI